jgi:hypothetical protein
MTKELTDRIKEEIVKMQVDFIKHNYPNEMINYDKLGEYLSESLRGYSSKDGEMNEKVDIKLLKSLQGTTLTSAYRLFHAARIINDMHFDDDDVRDKHLIKLHENDEYARRHFRNYGKKTSKILSDYLTKKGFIKE